MTITEINTKLKAVRILIRKDRMEGREKHLKTLEKLLKEKEALQAKKNSGMRIR
jgi:hypothetical protein